VPRLSNNAMCKHRWLGDQWHSVLGLGPFPPPEAIRISRRDMANGTTFQSMSTQLMKSMQIYLDSFFGTQFKETLKDSISVVLQQQQHELGILTRGASSQGTSGYVDNSSEYNNHASSKSCPHLIFCRHCIRWSVLTSCKRLH
jgi:hypothetical protein